MSTVSLRYVCGKGAIFFHVVTTLSNIDVGSFLVRCNGRRRATLSRQDDVFQRQKLIRDVACQLVVLQR